MRCASPVLRGGRPSSHIPSPRAAAPFSRCSPRTALGAQFREHDNLFCRYTFSHGPDWRILQGIDHGFSQVAQKGGGGGEANTGVVWNFPIDVTFKTTNPHGWPRVVVSVYSQVRPLPRPLAPCARALTRPPRLASLRRTCSAAL